jgi:hypothetical protein
MPSPQLFKPFPDFNPEVVRDVAMLTIRAVDSQEGEQVADPASQVHNHLVHMFVGATLNPRRSSVGHDAALYGAGPC